MRIEAFTVDNVPRVKGGDDITDFLQGADLRDGDVVVIASTIISKAEGLMESLETFSPSERACRIAERLHEDPRFIEAVLGETTEILIEKPFFLVVSKFGQVCVNGGWIAQMWPKVLFCSFQMTPLKMHVSCAI